MSAELGGQPLSNTEEELGSNDDENEYNKEEVFAEMWNDRFYPLFTDMLEEDWEQTWDESDNKLEDKSKCEYKKKKNKRINCLGEQRQKQKRGKERY